ncbi:hypothetical protein [Pseudorhodobacter sp.]|uniref:hypothetical protein n=1 Tax=Pseudorhodobacter sp. TaxID=1934400 RepID=UPI0026488707|nr:hypothetical protein [Pseudorhodobacter sp.]MDN5787428.1 hypothetical protein [Pseudorhodobacter sp.]
MVVGVMFSGFVAGLLGVVASLTAGAPIWIAVLLYPLLGTVGAIGFVAIALARQSTKQAPELLEFATELP